MTEPLKTGDKVVLQGAPDGPISGEVDFTFACPFCGGHVMGASDGKIIFHALPYCDRFRDLTVPEFIHACCVCFGLTEGGDA